jgi:hypothetical protein
VRQHNRSAVIEFGLVMLAGCAAEQRDASWQDAHSAAAAEPDACLGSADAVASRNYHRGRPMVYVNGAPLAKSVVSTVYYHDFQPGTYRLTVQPFGTPANLIDTLQLSPGTENYVQVQAVPNWEMGSVVGGASFAVLTMSPAEAKSYLPTMKYLGHSILLG